MSSQNIDQLMRLAWINKNYSPKKLKTQTGETVTVINHGEITNHNGIEIVNAEIKINDQHVRGTITVHPKSSDWRQSIWKNQNLIESSILDVVLSRDVVTCRTNSEIIPAVEIQIPELMTQKHNLLTSSRGQAYCGKIISTMNSVEQCAMITRLTVERLERKYNDFLSVYEKSDKSWIQTFYIMLFRTMGAGSNQEAYTRLAQKVTYHDLCKVKASMISVEALLLGAAGMLNDEKQDFFPDQYTINLQKEFEQLRLRFAITPMKENEWDITNKHSSNHPVTRIVELAALLSAKEVIFDQLLKCTNKKEIYKVLSAEASDYWSTHYLPSVKSSSTTKRIGSAMLNILTINLVLPMIFTHGKVVNDEQTSELAIDILDTLDPEDNKYTRTWRATGIEIKSAFYSQGLLQLSKEFCEKNYCTRCNIGRNVLMSK